MKKLSIALAFSSALTIAAGSSQLVKAETIFHVGEGQDCPKYTKPSGDGYCKAFVNNRFTGAYPNGACPAGSGPVGQGYCMYNY